MDQNDIDTKHFREWFEGNPCDWAESNDVEPYLQYKMHSGEKYCSYQDAIRVECMCTYKQEYAKWIEVYKDCIYLSMRASLDGDTKIDMKHFTEYGTDEEYFQFMCTYDTGGITEEELRDLVAISVKLRGNQLNG